MREYLLFQLYGPMQAWGDVAVGEIRPTAMQPTRSAVFGLAASALGIQRHEEDKLAALDSGYGLAVRVDAPGSLLTDFHTVQWAKPRAKRRFYIRADEVGGMLGPGESPSTRLTRREYLADALFTACLWGRDHAPHPLADLARALERPVFMPYLGRRSCPASLPFNPVLGRYPGLGEALAAYAPDAEFLKKLGRGRGSVAVFADADAPGLEAFADKEGRVSPDMPLHHGRRQFANRLEYAFRLPRAKAANQGGE